MGKFFEDVMSLNFEQFNNFKNEKELIEYIYDEYYISQKLSMAKIGNILNKDSSSISTKFKKYNLKARNCREMTLKYDCDERYFETINTEEKAYWLGFLTADGFIQKSTRKGCSRKLGLSLQECDKNHIEKFKQAISSNHPIHTYQCSGQSYNLNSAYSRIIISSEKMVADIENKGCVEHKSNIVKFPNENQVPHCLLIPYIRGYFDGNGSVSISKQKSGAPAYRIRFISTENMLNGIQNFLLSNGIINRTYPFIKRKEEHIVLSFDFGGNNQSYKFLKWLYGDATIYLDRKYKRYLSLKEYINNKQEAA